MFFDLNELLYTSTSNADLAREWGLDVDAADNYTSVWEVKIGGWREFRIVATILGTADERCDRGTATYAIERVLAREYDPRFGGSWSGWFEVPEHLPGCGSDSRW